MVDQDILLAKIASIRKCLDRIRNVTGGVPESLDHQDTQDIFVLNLQRAVQAAIDLVADLKLGLPETLKENFALLETSQIVDAALSARLQAMAGFRNIAVHNYQQLNVAILKSILAHRISDLEHFVQAVSERYRRT